MQDKELISRAPIDWTEYMWWLTFTNVGMLLIQNVNCFIYAIKNLPSNSPMLEIGTYAGLSANMLTYLKNKHGVTNKLITCDKWIFETYEDMNDNDKTIGDITKVNIQDIAKLIRSRYIENAKMFSSNDLPSTIEMFSDEFFEAWKNKKECIDIFNRNIKLGGPISFCYIDGNHSYDFVKRDFENCDKYLEVGGFILFDDSSDDSVFPAKNVVKDVINTKRYEIISKDKNYFFKKINNG